MSVVFDEVVGRVEAPQEPLREEQNEEQPLPPQHDTRSWQQQQSTCLRRQQRLEAD